MQVQWACHDTLPWLISFSLERSLLMSATLLFVIVLALAWYNVGTIWAHEIDIFRTWRIVPAASFHAVQTSHWHKLPYWVFLPVGLTLLGSTALVWYHPPLVPRLALAGNAACQLLSAVLTGWLWGPWQAALSRDPAGSASDFLARILRTHWIRTFLITAGGVLLLVGLGSALYPGR
jgi:hypothetical protein